MCSPTGDSYDFGITPSVVLTLVCMQIEAAAHPKLRNPERVLTWKCMDYVRKVQIDAGEPY